MASRAETQEPAAVAAAAAVTNTAASEAANTEIAQSADLTTAQCSASETEVQHDQDIEKAKGAAPAEEDPNIVFWDGDDDPQNPYNWPTWVKVFNCVLISALTFVTPLASCKYTHKSVYL